MQEVNVYTYVSARDLNKRDRAVGYVLEVQTSKGPEKREKFGILEDVTEKQAQLIVLTLALQRLTKSCVLNIYTDSDYVASAYNLGWMKHWKKNFWMNAKGKKIANCKEWTDLDMEMRKHAHRFHVKQDYECRQWLKDEVNKLVRR